ncbi:creatininase family protein [Lutispora sp.]|uniref:creatininase family protein n=1 Tax=Lutispora sp. TaxID=2828727 RepID=UPI000EBDD743|nr:creatininase family protein [Lutispora sp.]MEA4962580.1 creatininase family protein [Lutispora sp.]HCJ58934.1 hypothetical protein [Clostridiaceae bacterium]
MNITKYELAKMTWKEAEYIFKQDKVFLIPLGSMEEHGPQSVLGDYMAAEEAAKETAKRSGAIMVPIIPFGYSEYFRDYPGTISFSPRTMYRVIEDIFECLMEHGAKKFLIVNGHGGNMPIIEMFGRDLRREKGIMIGKFDLWQVLSPQMKEELYGENASRCMGHGGEPVTSVMKYLRPDDIRMDLVDEMDRVYKWQDFELANIGKTNIAGMEASIYFNIKDATNQGCLADPRYGNAEIGKKIFERMVEVGCEFVKRMENSEMKI